MIRRKTSIVILLLVAVAFVSVAARCFYLAVFRIEDYQKASQKSQLSYFTEKPRRGAILDCRGRTMAMSLKLNTVFAEPRAVADIDTVAKQLSGIIDVSRVDIIKAILTARNPGYAPISKDIVLTDEQRKRISQIRGIGIETDWKRSYPLGASAAHVVGFVGTDGSGLSGIELEYDKLLRGSPGRSTFFSDVARRPIGLMRQASFAVDGSDIILTIDSVIQEFAYRALSRRVREYRAESGFAVVMDPHSGAVLAMVSVPSFDPQDFSGANSNSMGDHLISDPFEPGSIFKPIVAAWAIDTGTFSTKDIIFCENGHYSGKGFGTIGEYHRGYGNLSIREILTVSSNIGMAKIGQKMGAEKIYKGVKLFGFGSRTGIDLPGEDPGLVWGLKNWTGYSIARVPFGHELLVTGIQIARAYCILANNGRIIKPYVASAVVDSSRDKLTVISPQVLGGYIIKPQTSKWIVQKALSDVVKKGTGRAAAMDGYQVWGKTGTANIAKSGDRGYDKQNYVASFAGGVPADDPLLVVLVSIRKPDKSLRKGYTGGLVAAPVVKEILEKTMRYLAP